MSWDPNKPIDEQSSFLLRWSPWLFVGAVVVGCTLWAVFG